jgi:hypothetical protein
MQRLYQFSGWVLFVFSAFFIIATSVRAGDMLGLIGGLFFLIACFVFLVPLVSTMLSDTDSSSQVADIEMAKRN